ALRRELGRAEVKFGYALARLGSRKEGLDYSHRGVQILESLAADGTDAESRRWLGMAHWMLGDILLLDGNATGALQSYQEELRIVAPLAVADPTNAVLQYDFGCAHARVGNALAILGNQKSGLVMFNRAVHMFEAQLVRDPAYTEPRFCLAASHIWMGEAFARTGNAAQALESYERGLAQAGSRSPCTLRARAPRQCVRAFAQKSVSCWRKWENEIRPLKSTNAP